MCHFHVTLQGHLYYQFCYFWPNFQKFRYRPVTKQNMTWTKTHLVCFRPKFKLKPYGTPSQLRRIEESGRGNYKK